MGNSYNYSEKCDHCPYGFETVTKKGRDKHIAAH
jgi:hypothetical protein